ncbi:unnamed protein product [Schistocephalus solidus]|uniref:Uncharacterized protein n=1 Tax=Schistocephalus solidus TaxID=70667 RepID=A0A3P7D1V0_SCHSO|nr:unnamed protein product [Schistocephalus solidus]
MSEISRNLKSRGIGRVFVKESETKTYSEPCFYVMKKIEPLMSDESGVRCRAFAERVFRGRHLGLVHISKSYEPDWRLLSIEEGRRLQESASQMTNVVQDNKVPCVAAMPPLLAVKLQRLGKIPPSVVEAARKVECPVNSASAKEANGFLLLTKHFDDPTIFQVPIEPTTEEKSRIFPSYEVQAADGLILKKKTDKNIYYIRRSDTPGLRWRVELAQKDIEDELLQDADH